MLNSQVEEIKAKIDIIDVISEYIPLKQAGANWRANCPFHNEKTPSFMVSRDKQIWHCFGCGDGGDAFTFVQKIENIDFPEALKILASKAGVTLKQIDPALTSQKTKLMDINKLAADFYHKALLISKEGSIARDYLAKRKLSDKTIETFYLGYSPNDWEKLLELLRKRGYKEAEILQSGLVVKNDKGKIYDRFRQRLMFPICDHNGNVVGFTARILVESQAEQGGKYINTPQTMIYNKSLIIYALDKAKNEIKKLDLAVIVEGNMDVIASHQAGVSNVIASSGTALTLEQLKILNRYTKNLALAFDADLAGQSAALRGIDNALSLGINVKIIELPKEINGAKIKDPDDCIKQSPQAWQQAITGAKSIMEYLFAKTFSQFDKKQPEGKKEIASRLLKHISKLIDKVEQDYWLSQLAEQLEVAENILRETFNDYQHHKDKQDRHQDDGKNTAQPRHSRDNLIAEQILALGLKFPENLPYLIDHLEAEAILNPELQTIYKQMILYYNNKQEFNYSEFEKILSTHYPQLNSSLTTLLLLADKDFFDFSSDKINQEIRQLVSDLKRIYINLKIKQIQKLLAQAEKEKNQKQIEELSKDFSHLTSQINNL